MKLPVTPNPSANQHSALRNVEPSVRRLVSDTSYAQKLLHEFLIATFDIDSPESIARLEKRRAAEKARKAAREAQKAEERKQQHLVVAVDLGCTYSGIAFIASIHQGGQVQVMNEWPAGDRMGKVPTRIAYANENAKPNNLHGYEITAGLKSYAWFKHQFDKNTKETEFDDPYLRKSSGLGIGRLPPGKSVVGVNADFLLFFICRSIQILEHPYGWSRGAGDSNQVLSDNPSTLE